MNKPQAAIQAPSSGADQAREEADVGGEDGGVVRQEDGRAWLRGIFLCRVAFWAWVGSLRAGKSSRVLWMLPSGTKSRILACIFRPSRSTCTQDVCEQLRPTCSINLPCHDTHKCSCSSRRSNFKTLLGHCFSLGRRGNQVRVRACNIRSECNKYDCR